MRQAIITKNREKNSENTRKIVCIRCNYSWNYCKVTIPKYRIRCSRCHSSQNDFNREIFGKWRPTL